jgi:hypothetical protein
MYGCFGRIGSTKAQSSSGTNNLPIASSMTRTAQVIRRLIKHGNGHF